MKALIFDMDGTIVDNISFHNLARVRFLEKYGIRINPSELNAINHISTKELVKRYIDPEITPERLRQLDNEKQEIYRSLYRNHVKEINGFVTLLDVAKNNGWLIGLATMGNRENIDMVIDALQVRAYFDVIVSGKDLSKGKPHPEIYQKTLSLLNIAPSEAIVFEDTYTGLTSAREAGLRVIGMCTLHSPSQFSEWGADGYIYDFEDYLEKYIELPCKDKGATAQ